jgi:hypothetical protein
MPRIEHFGPNNSHSFVLGWRTWTALAFIAFILGAFSLDVIDRFWGWGMTWVGVAIIASVPLVIVAAHRVDRRFLKIKN